MRTFIGIDFRTGVKEHILNMQNTVRKYAQKGRWKYVDNFHLTLKFLDEIDDKTLDLIDNQLKKISANHQSFELGLSKLGAFGRKLEQSSGQEYIRTLYLGFSGEINKLKELQKNIEDSLWTIGIEKENKPYTPHLTMAQDVLLETGLNEIEKYVDPGSTENILVDRIYVYKSEQIGRKRVYTKIREYIFKEDN